MPTRPRSVAEQVPLGYRPATTERLPKIERADVGIGPYNTPINLIKTFLLSPLDILSPSCYYTFNV